MIMVDFFIYTGLGIMLLGSLFGIYVGFKGMKSLQENGSGARNILSRFEFRPVSPELKRLINIWRLIMLIGMVVTGIGLAIGLNQG